MSSDPSAVFRDPRYRSALRLASGLNLGMFLVEGGVGWPSARRR
jgi:hypothetical protein